MPAPSYGYYQGGATDEWTLKETGLSSGRLLRTLTFWVFEETTNKEPKSNILLGGA